MVEKIMLSSDNNGYQPNFINIQPYRISYNIVKTLNTVSSHTLFVLECDFDTGTSCDMG